MRRRVKKSAAQTAVQPAAAKPLDMPLPEHRVAEAALSFADGAAFLVTAFPKAPVWKLALTRTAKATDAQIASSFSPLGSRFVHAFEDVPAEPTAKAPTAATPAASGLAEFGLQGDGDHEYFLSKFGDLVGVVRIKRKEDGAWSASMAKTLMPRVLSDEAVGNGLMPPLGHSALPQSLEAVVPAEYAYWKAADIESARSMRDALVESGFFGDDCIKAVDGELRKVEVRYFLYEPQTDVMAPATTEKKIAEKPDGWHVFSADGVTHLGGPYKTKEEALARLAEVEGHKKSFGDRILKTIPERLIGAPLSTPMAEEDWLEALDKADAEGVLAVLSPPDRGVPAREMVRAVASLKGDYLLEHEDTDANRAEFAKMGVLFKLHGEPSRILCSSFPPVLDGVRLVKAPEPPPEPETSPEEALVETTTVDRLLTIGKADTGAEQRYVLGIVLEPDVIDAQNDTYSAEEVRQAAEKFMESYRNVGLMHKQMVTGKVEIIESYVAPVDMQLGETAVKKGTWLMAVRVRDDDLWQAVKGGQLTGFSIGGSAIRKPVSEGV